MLFKVPIFLVNAYYSGPHLGVIGAKVPDLSLVITEQHRLSDLRRCVCDIRHVCYMVPHLHHHEQGLGHQEHR